MFKLLRYLKPYWKAAVLAPLLMILEVYMDLLQPKLISSIVNEGILKQDLQHIGKIGALMVGTSLIGLVGGIGCTIFSSIAAQNFGADLRQGLFEKVQTFSFRNLDELKTGSLVTRLTNDVVQVQNAVLMGMRVLVRAPFLALGSLIMALSISLKLGLIFLVTIPVLAITLTVVIRKGFPLFAKVQQKLDGVNTVLQENLAGIRVVKAFVRGDYEQQRFQEANDGLMDIAVQANRIVGFTMPLMMLIMNASIVAVLWFGGLQTWQGQINLGDLIAFINYVTQLLFALLILGVMLMMVSRAKASSERINEVMETESDIVDPLHSTEKTIERGEVVFDQVSFGYDQAGEELVLKNINLRVWPGQTIAILGATGSGKSTLVNLIPRLYDPTKGRVLIDGTDIRDMRLEVLRCEIGMVLQEAILFSGSIRENIAFGRPEATQEAIEAAAKAAQAHDFIINLPEGYDTQLGQRGINLSGGQKQRLAIARALLIKPQILILDDSTSAVDLRTEAHIQKALRKLMKDSTSFVIAQRISSVMEADQIIVLEEGSIVAQGNHAELLRSSSVYQEIYRSQLGEGEVANG